MRIQNKKTFASILFVLISFVCVAQNVPTPPAPPPPPGTPIDGGILICMVLGLIYGVSKMLRNSKQ